jgi:branched-chain amino acid transport system substrate-binding protein
MGHKIASLAFASALFMIGSSARAADPGISDSEIIIGGTYAFSGAASFISAVAHGSEAYFKYINSQGGVQMADGKKRKIEFKTYDDGYETARALGNVQRLVLQDHVFLDFSNGGTPPNLAIRPFLNEHKVPQLFVFAPVATFGNEYKKYPWSIGWYLTYETEAQIYANFLRREHPHAKVAMLVVSSDAGRATADAFEAAIKNTDIKIVAKRTFDVTSPSVESDIVELSHSDADVFFSVSTGRSAAQAVRKAGEINWKPLRIIWSQGASIAAVLRPAGIQHAEGGYTLAFLKDPSDSHWANDPDIELYKKIIQQYGPNPTDPNDTFVLQGVAQAATLVEVLKRSEPTRESVMKQVRNIPPTPVMGLLPGIKVETGGANQEPIRSGQLMQLESGRWTPVGDLIRPDAN